MTTGAAVDAERARLAALREYGILDTPREEPFDRLVRLASRVLGTPIAAVSLVDAERVWFKAEIGLGVCEVPRDLAMCSLAIAGTEAVYEVRDTGADPAFAGNPLLDPPVDIRYYAGATLVTPAGFRIGTLCVIDHAPRPGLTEEQRATLVDLAGSVMTELERRREQRLRERASARLALLKDILAEVGGAAGFVAATEAAMRRLCTHVGASFTELWQQAEGNSVRPVAFAANPDMPASVRDAAFAAYPALARVTDLAPLLAGDAPLLMPEVTEASVAALPLLHANYLRGMRSYLVYKLPVGAARYVIALCFDTPRADLPEIAGLLDEVGQAIRPALLRKRAEERLALLNDLLAVIAGAPNFLAGIDRAIALLCRDAGAVVGAAWERIEPSGAMRLLALAGAASLPAGLRARAFTASPLPPEPLLHGLAAGGRLAMHALPSGAADHPGLLALCRDAGMQCFVAQGFTVADARLMLLLGFDSARGDLEEVADLLGETVQAIRPAVLRKQAEDRLALINDVLGSVAGAATFRGAIETVLDSVCRHLGAIFGLMWDKADGTDDLRLVAARAGETGRPDLPAVAAAAFPISARESLLASLLETESSRVGPRLTEAMAKAFPLVGIGRGLGMRSFAAQSLLVGGHPYVLCIAFDTERQDLEQVADLLAEVGRAIRPALQHKQAETRLALLQAAMDATADAVVVTDAATAAPADTRVLQVNAAFTRMTGYAPEDVQGRNMRLLQGAGTDHAAVRRLHDAVALRRPAREELLNYRRDGTPFWVELDIAPFADERGEVANWVGVLRDTTERRATHEALQHLAGELQERTTQLTELARLARIGSWTWRADSPVMTWSDETYDLLGVERGRVAPHEDTLFGLLEAEDAERLRFAGRHALRTGDELHVELRVKRPGGRSRAIIWNGTVRRRADGDVPELRGYCQDVTERRETEAVLHHGEKLRALGALTGGIAHEFNNLLTVVQANLELALDDSAELAAARPELEAARRAALAGTALTARLLAFARSEPLRSETTDIGEWLGPLREMATRTIGQRYDVTLHADPSLPPVSVDRSQLEGAVLNLILNARDAMPGGGEIAIETGRIEVRPGARGALADLSPGSYAVVVVRDQGAGMSADVLQRAFEPFFTTKPSGSGTGLGLSTVLSFARQSGGTTLIDTAPGHGTTVRLVLPLG